MNSKTLTRIAVTVCGSMLVVFAFSARAFALPWVIGAQDQTMSNPSLSGEARYYWTGTSSYTYVMSNPTIYYAHINSIYMRTGSGGNTYELGWQWKTTPQNASPPYGTRDTLPFWFRYIKENGVEKTPSGGERLEWAATNNNNLLRVQVDGQNVVMTIDQRTWIWSPAVTNQGLSVWGSERVVTANGGESNFAHFWALGKRNHAFQWVAWQNLEPFKTQSDHANGYHLWRLNEDAGWSSMTSPGAGTVHVY